MSDKNTRNNPDDCRPVDYRQSKLQRELYRLVVLDKAVNLVAIAEDLGKKPDTIYAYCEGELRLHVDEAARIIRSIARTNMDAAMELLVLFVPTGLSVVREVKIKVGTIDDLREQQLGLSRLVGKIQDKIQEAQSDGRIDRAEHKAISRKVAELKTIATELDERLGDGL